VSFVSDRVSAKIVIKETHANQR